MKKNALSLFSILALVIVLMVPGITSASNQPNITYAALSSEQLAYADLDAAPEEWKEAILDSREAIIYSTSWTVDGQMSIEHADGTIEELPEFSDLFPDWDVPNLYETEPTSLTARADTPNMRLSVASYVGFVYLFAPSDTSASLPFYSFSSSANRVTMQASSLPGTSWNGGFTNLNTGSDVGHYTYLSASSRIHLNTPNSSTFYGARASTFSTTGSALMSVYDDPI